MAERISVPLDAGPTPLSIFGLGYVGSVSAGCFASRGHRVIGVDPQQIKVDLINEGKAPIVEEGLDGLLRDAVASERLRATADHLDAIANSDLSMVCVGTPSRENGSLNIDNLVQVCRQIGEGLRRKEAYHVVVIRSTILPGTMREVIQPTLEEASGKRAGSDFGLANNPEFLREGTAVRDFREPPKTVIGAIDDRAGEIVQRLYADIDAPLIRTSIEVGEMVKYADNAWHALKVVFANEVGNIAKAMGIDSHEVMDIFCQDTKLNLSPTYLRPGFAFGGSCLPKDVRALTYKARTLDIEVPVLNAILPSNARQVERALQRIQSKGIRRVGVLGFSFKAGTDDLRESPQVELIERLIGKGYDLRLYDPNVRMAKLMGANRQYILKVIPHISELMVDRVEEVLDHAELVVLGNNDAKLHDIAHRLKADQIFVDLVRVPDRGNLADRYDGINW